MGWCDVESESGGFNVLDTSQITSHASFNPSPVDIHVVLVEPEIPSNTGNIARTCAALGATLHLVHPLGFSLEDRYLKRAGLDYWPLVQVVEHPSWNHVEAQLAGHRFFYLTTKAKRHYHEYRYQAGDVFVFGKETKGLPEALLSANPDTLARLPMRSVIRSLNLSNAVAIVLYEAYRQLGFPDLG